MRWRAAAPSSGPRTRRLDNLTFVINCNLQRLDGPVRGNGKIIQELESFFRGAGWNVIKVVWGREWDELLARDSEGALVDLMNRTPDGDYQTYKAESGAYVREHFFGRDPRVAKLIEGYTDDQLWNLKRGGHDYRKVYAAFKAATEHKGQPTVILAKTVKGYGLGPSFEGRNATHQMKKLTLDNLKQLRDVMRIPFTDAQLEENPYEPPFYHPGENDPAIQYLQERRRALGGYVPERHSKYNPVPLPDATVYEDMTKGSGKQAIATTMAFATAAEGPAAGEGLRPPDRADHPGRGTHVRHGRLLPDREDLQPGRPAVHRRGPRPAARLQGEPAGPDPARRHQRSRSVRRVHRSRHVVRHARRGARARLRLLLDVRVPAHGRRHVGGGRPDDPRVHHGCHRRPHDADR